VPDDRYRTAGNRSKVLRVRVLDREDCIGPVQRLAFLRGAGGKELVGLAVPAVQPEPVGEDIVGVDQRAGTVQRFEQFGVENVGGDHGIETRFGPELAQESGCFRIEVAVHR